MVVAPKNLPEAYRIQPHNTSSCHVRHCLLAGIEEVRFGLGLECTSLSLFATTLGNLGKRYDLKTSKGATLTE